MTDIAIRVENLSKLYHIGKAQERHDTLRDALVSTFKRFNVQTMERSTEHWALRDVSFEVKQGEVVGIIGRNGAGKSTLLKILSRITEPTSGRVELHGRVASLLEVGTGFHPELTGRENIYLNGAILGMKRREIDRQFDEIVAFAEIEKFLDTPVKRYSSGMYVRLAFAVAAHLEPEILLVDEVLAVGDAAFQKKCLGKMGDVAKEGRTVLFVSHNMGAIANMCNRLIYLDYGAVKCDGETLLCIQQYMDDTRPSQFVEYVQEQIGQLSKDLVCEVKSMEVIQRGIIQKEVVSHSDIHVAVDYFVKQSVFGLRIGFDIIHDASGTTVFRSFHDDIASSVPNTLPGYYRSEAVIPANLLTAGRYRLSLLVGIHNVRWIIVDQIFYWLHVSNIKGVNVRYSDKRPGIVMPLILWETSKIDTEINDARL